MAYHNQVQTAISSPKGIDKVIEDICTALSEVSWLSNIYRRAWLISDANAGANSFTPQVYLENMQYYKVLPNDNFTALSFVQVTSPERRVSLDEINTTSYEPQKERDLSLVVWCNLKKVDSLSDYIFTELLRAEIEPLLSSVDGLVINSYIDEDYRQIFAGYDISQTENKFFAYPYAAFRFNCTVTYGGKLRIC